MRVKWTPELVADRFEEAVQIMRKLPRDAAIVQFNQKSLNYLINDLLPKESRLEPHATLEEIIRFKQALNWTTWVDEFYGRVIWQRAARTPWKTMCLKLGYGKTSIWHKRIVGLTKISTQLNATEMETK